MFFKSFSALFTLLKLSLTILCLRKASLNLLRNDSEARNWVMFELQQNQNNFYAVGATVELFSGNEKQINYLAAGNGYCSQNTFDIHFGLDTINYIDSVKIFWPDNQDEVFYDINVNNKNILIRGDGSLMGKLNQTSPTTSKIGRAHV